MNVFGRFAPLFVLAALGACQTAPSTPSGSGKSAALLAMEQVAIAAQKCWFASRDEAFRPYRMADELNSFSGRPRILLVPEDDFGGRPLLVVQAEGDSARVEAFGPLMKGPQGARIAKDVRRWAGGDASCGSSA